jgi:hypothetical protein
MGRTGAQERVTGRNSRRFSVADKLKEGDLFPHFSVETVNHGKLTLPDDIQTRWMVLLFYRGWW